MVFEFAKDAIVVEVTFTDSSRQEAAEGEPVRRHVAVYADQNPGKEVMGLFIAPNIDSNTADTFRLGQWYRKDDSKVNVDIVPMYLEDFRSLLSAGSTKLPALLQSLRELLIRCRARANADAPVWKKSIRDLVKATCTQLAA